MRELLIQLIQGWDEPVPFAAIVHDVHWSCVANSEPEPSEEEIHQMLKDLRREGLLALSDGPKWSYIPQRPTEPKAERMLFA